MAAIHGKNGHLTINTFNFSSYLKSTGLDTSNDVVEVTTFGSNSKVYIPGLKDGTIPLEGIWNATIDAQLAAIETAGTVAFVYGPAGSTGGFVEFSGNCIMSSFGISQDTNGDIVFSATLQITGDVVRGTF